MAVVAKITENAYLIGLEAGNIERMKAGRPFHKNLKDFGGPDITVYVIYGETAEAILNELADNIGPETEIRDPKKRLRRQ